MFRCNKMVTSLWHSCDTMVTAVWHSCVIPLTCCWQFTTHSHQCNTLVTHPCGTLVTHPCGMFVMHPCDMWDPCDISCDIYHTIFVGSISRVWANCQAYEEILWVEWYVYFSSRTINYFHIIYIHSMELTSKHILVMYSNCVLCSFILLEWHMYICYCSICVL